MIEYTPKREINILKIHLKRMSEEGCDNISKTGVKEQSPEIVFVLNKV